jgi:hypothetical protein
VYDSSVLVDLGGGGALGFVVGVKDGWRWKGCCSGDLGSKIRLSFQPLSENWENSEPLRSYTVHAERSDHDGHTTGCLPAYQQIDSYFSAKSLMMQLNHSVQYLVHILEPGDSRAVVR